MSKISPTYTENIPSISKKYLKKSKTYHKIGNGPLNAMVHAMSLRGWKNFDLLDYRSHSLGLGSATASATYIEIKHKKTGKLYWGCGIHTNIRRAGLLALISAYNRMTV